VIAALPEDGDAQLQQTAQVSKGKAAIKTSFPGRMQSQGEQVSVLPSVKWEDYKTDLGVVEALRQNQHVRAKVPDLDRVLEDVEDKVDDLKFDDEAADLVKLLDEDELSSIVSYTHDLQQADGKREGNLYFEENQDLRKRDLESRALMLQTWGTHVYHAMRGLGKLPDFVGEVFRGFTNLEDVVKQYKKGRKIQWGAFSSTTVDKKAAKGFAGQGGAVLKIDLFTGKDIQKLSFFAKEGEILLSPNHKFMVTSDPYSEDGFTFVNMMELKNLKPYIS